MEIEECYDLCPMRCLSDGPIQNYDCSNMGYPLELHPSMHMVDTLDLSLFNDVYWPFALTLVVK